MGLIREVGSKSTTFKKIDNIIQLICREIDNCQEVKRLLAYPTKNPLDYKGITYDDKVYYQNDINKSLMSNIKLDVSKTQDGSNIIDVNQCIFDMGWNNSKDIELKNAIYVSHLYSGVELIDKAVFIITIIIPTDYNRLYESNRGHDIGGYILDLFHNAKTDYESSVTDGLGDLEFKLGGKINEGKITKRVDATIIEIPFSINLTNFVIKEGNL